MTVFLDANIAMYLVGSAHPNRDRCVDVLDQLVLDDRRLVTDAEVFQEILHRYSAIGRPAGLSDAYRTMNSLVDEVLAITLEHTDAAKALVLEGIGARDAIHVATMRSVNITQILTFDRGFDRFEDLERLS